MSGKKQVVWFHACFPASPAASQAACFYFSSIRTGLSCLESFKNLCSLDAHWQNSLTLCKKFWGVFVDLECILLLHIWHFSGTLVICLNMFVAAVYRTIPSNEEIYLRIHY